MPLYDFKCPKCNTVREVLVVYAELKTRVVRCNAERLRSSAPCGTVMEPQPCSPSQFRINGFNALNHYGAKQMDTVTRGEKLIGAAGRGMKVTTHEAS